jgi:hypothetical protein
MVSLSEQYGQPISKSLKELIVSMIVEHIFRLSFCLRARSFLISQLKFFVTSHVSDALRRTAL